MSDFNQEEDKIVRSWIRDFKIKLSESQIHLLGIYLYELGEWNKRFNLTGHYSRLKIIIELLLDSLIPSPTLPEEGRLLDVGSGAGFPGIPLKICKPRLKVHLMEPNSKKGSFLKQVIRMTKLREIEILRGRIEKDEDILHPEGYEVITARALAGLPKTLEWCAPNLMPGGLIVSFQGSGLENSFREAAETIKKHRLSLHRSISYMLPGKDSQRHLVIFKKNG